MPSQAQPDFSEVLDLLERQREEGLHDGAQLYVSKDGKTLLDAAVGESQPGRAFQPDDVLLWYSSSKPITAVAIMQLWEQGRLGLDDPVAKYVEHWGNGKERCTIRHVLTHTCGFPMYRERLGDQDLDYAERVARIAAHPAEWEPGTKASYHLTTGWTILGAIVEAVDGRPVEQYAAEEIFAPAGMADTHMGVPVATQEQLGDRLVPMQWKGFAMPVRGEDGRVDMRPYDIQRAGHNEPWYRARVEPGSSCQGPSHDLARFYECLLGFGPRLLDPKTVEVMIACHRYGMRDAMFGNLKIPWGLGVNISGTFNGGPGRRAFGHGGLGSSRGLADPDAGLVMVFIANGLPDPVVNEQRHFLVTDGVYRAFGDDVAHLRRPGRPPIESEVTYSS